MQLTTLLAIAMPAVLGASAGQPDLLGGTLKSIGLIQKFLDIDVAARANFTAEDLVKIGAKLADPDAVKGLLVDEVVSFNLTDLTIPEHETEQALIDAAMSTRNGLEHYLLSKVANKTDKDLLQDTRNDIRTTLTALDKVDNLKEKLFAQVSSVFSQNPAYASIFKYTLAAAPNVFGKKPLDYIRLLAGIGNESFPDVTDKIVMAVDLAQEQFDLFPQDFYNKLLKAFAGKP